MGRTGLRRGLRAMALTGSIVLLSSCSSVREWAQDKTRNDVFAYVERMKGKITAAEINACIQKRTPPLKAYATGAPTFEPNLFYTCLAVKSPQVGSLFTGEGDHIAYEVHLPARGPIPGDTLPFQPAKAGGASGYYRFNCLFRVRKDGIDVYEARPREETFGTQIVAGRLHETHVCLAMPGAQEQVRRLLPGE
jgi:hypothetical protein